MCFMHYYVRNKYSMFYVSEIFVLNSWSVKNKSIACAEFVLLCTAVSGLTQVHLGDNLVRFTAGGMESFRTWPIPSERPGKRLISLAIEKTNVADKHMLIVWGGWGSRFCQL